MQIRLVEFIDFLVSGKPEMSFVVVYLSDTAIAAESLDQFLLVHQRGLGQCVVEVKRVVSDLLFDDVESGLKSVSKLAFVPFRAAFQFCVPVAVSDKLLEPVAAGQAYNGCRR